jgi:hypothetical protein
VMMVAMMTIIVMMVVMMTILVMMMIEMYEMHDTMIMPDTMVGSI